MFIFWNFSSFIRNFKLTVFLNVASAYTLEISCVRFFYYLYIIRILLPFNTRNFLNRKFAIISYELLVLINIKVIHCIEVFKSFMLTLECLIRLIFLFWTCSHLQSIRWINTFSLNSWIEVLQWSVTLLMLFRVENLGIRLSTC